MKPTFKIIAIVGSLITGACSSSSIPPEEIPITEGLSATNMGQGEAPLEVEAQRTVIKDQETLDQMFEELEINFSFDVDFNTEMVIVAVMGKQTSENYSIYIESYEILEDEMGINIINNTYNGSTVSAFMNPYHIAKVPRSDATISFEESNAITDCEESAANSCIDFCGCQE